MSVLTHCMYTLKVAMAANCEDDPCDANGGGGDEEAANGILGEFDDGY
nr:unnamed protein product [Digitaria exilis]